MRDEFRVEPFAVLRELSREWAVNCPPLATPRLPCAVLCPLPNRFNMQFTICNLQFAISLHKLIGIIVIDAHDTFTARGTSCRWRFGRSRPAPRTIRRNRGYICLEKYIGKGVSKGPRERPNPDKDLAKRSGRTDRQAD